MDAMVTARMPSQQKQLGNAIIEQAGTTPSALIGKLYNYIISEGVLPDLEPSRPAISEKEKADQYCEYIQGTVLSVPASFWETELSDDELLTQALEEKYGFAH